MVNFFESTENTQRYLDEHDQVSGFPLSIPEAIDAGRAVFADLLMED